LADLIPARPVVVWAAAPRSAWMRDDYQGTARMEAPAPATGLAVTSGISVSQVMPPSHPPQLFLLDLFLLYLSQPCFLSLSLPGRGVGGRGARAGHRSGGLGGWPHQPCHGLERPCSQRKTQRRLPPSPPEIRTAGMRSSGLSSPSRRGRRHDGGPQRPPLLLEALWLWEEPTQPSRGPSFLKLRRGRARGCRQSGRIGVVTMTRCSGSASSQPRAYACLALPIVAGFLLFPDAGHRRRMQQGRSGALEGGRARGMVVRGT
jgi:hypothetical protein